MDAFFNETLDFVFERARATKAVMDTLAAAPYEWTWTGVSPADFGEQIETLDAQVDALAEAEADTTLAASLWEQDLDSLVADAALGTRSARVNFEAQPVKARLFSGLTYPTAGRDARYKQAHRFEKAWAKSDAAWTFKAGLTLTKFKTRREAIKSREDAHVTAENNEKHERAVLHSLAEEANRISVNWYELATANFPADSVAGQLIRSIPTTYDPNRAPGPLRFTTHLSAAPNQVHLVWRAARGEKFFISARRPGAVTFDVILNGVTDTEWLRLGLTPGAWAFQGYATNQYGQGEASEAVSINVAAAAAAA